MTAKTHNNPVIEKKLIFVINSTFPSYSGGIENWLYNILKSIPEGYTVRILSIKKTNAQPFYDIPLNSKISVKQIVTLRSKKYYELLNKFPFRLIMFVEQIYWIIKATYKLVLDDSEIIVALHSIPTIIPCIIAKGMNRNKKVICSVRGVVGDDYLSMSKYFLAKIYMILEKFFLTKADKVLANGWDTKKYLLNIGIDSTVSPNGVDYKKFSKNYSVFNENSNHIRMLIEKQKGGAKLLVHVATLRGKIKGIEDVIYLASRIKKESQYLNEFYILFVGKGNSRPYKQIAEKLGVLNQCIFLGEIKKVERILHISDIVVCLFRGGGTSQAVIESMAAGKPIITWDTLFYSQIIQNNIHGLLIEKNNFSDMVKAIDKILSNHSLTHKLSKNAQKKAEWFDWTQVRKRLFNEINHV